MKTILLLAALLAVAAQEPPELPPGEFCSVAGAHPCACKRMDHDDSCEGQPTHDPVCKQWCHEDHCRCPILCAAPTP